MNNSNLELMERRLKRERQARKAAEKLLEEKSREIFEANKKLSQVALFAELNPHPVLRFNIEGELQLANKAAQNVLGPHVTNGSSIDSILPQLVDNDLRSIIEEDRIYQVSARIGQNYFQFVLKGISTYGFANVYASDITLEVLVKKQMEQLHRETEQIISAISSILISVDKDSKVKCWNKMAEKSLGITNTQVLGQHFESCNIPWKLGSLKGYIQDSKLPDRAIVPEVAFTNPEGKEGFLSAVITLVNDKEGRFDGYLILATDVTERKVLETQLVQAQKLESLGQLAAGIAHEINTPIQFIGDNTRFLNVAFQRLNNVIDKSRMLLEEAKDGSGMLGEIISDVEETIKKAKLDYMSKEIPFAIEETLGGVDQVATIVKAMKQFSHPGTKQKKLANINDAISSTINVARNEWKYVADLEAELAADMPEIPCLQSELNQVFLNMIVNAAHAIEEKNIDKREKGEIIIKTVVREQFAEVHISDNGAGMPDHIIARIFDPFFTTKEVGKGSGQGLSVAYNVVYDKHGGNIDVHSVPGEGTTFVIRLPLELATAEVEK